MAMKIALVVTGRVAPDRFVVDRCPFSSAGVLLGQDIVLLIHSNVEMDHKSTTRRWMGTIEFVCEARTAK
jgi:hypothetical protein